MPARSCKRLLAASLVVLQLGLFVQLPLANAALLGTPQVLQEQQRVDRQQLRAMLDDQQVRQQLEELGVAREQVQQRIDSLTPAELARFNRQLAEDPAGASAAGIIVLFLVIFIITDMLCATDLFSFVKCLR